MYEYVATQIACCGVEGVLPLTVVSRDSCDLEVLNRLSCDSDDACAG